MRIREIFFRSEIISSQRGAALLVSLIILLAISLLGLSMMQNSTIEEKMSANMGDMGLAFQRAELGLRTAEDLIEAETDFVARYPGNKNDVDSIRIETGSTNFAADCSNGRCYAVGGVAQATKVNALLGNDNTLYYSVNDAGGDEVARYLVEFSCQDVTDASNCVYVFTVTARGLGDNNSQVVLEETYRTE